MSTIFDPLKFCEFSLRRSEISMKNVNYLLAAAFKSRRLQLNMTLDEVTRDICSKAYLCKFENNQITIDEKVARCLCERVDLDYDKIISLGQSNNLVTGIRMFLFNQNEQIDGLIQSLDFDCFIASNKILELLAALVNYHFERCEELIIEIDRVRSTLTEYEFLAFGVCILEYYIRTNQFIKAKSFIKGFSCDIRFKELKYLYLEQKFNVYFNLCETGEAYNAYRLLEKEFNTGYPRKREFLDKLRFIELFSSSKTIKELQDMLDDMIPTEYIEEYWYTYCMCLMKANNYTDCMQIIQKHDLASAQFVALYTYSANMVARMIPQNKDKEPLSKRLSSKTIVYMNSLVERMEKNHLNTIDRNFIKLMQLELVSSSDEELASYIKEVALKFDKFYQHRFYSYIYAHHLFEILGNMTRYKEAYLIAKSDRSFK